jgi:hypothetical protein
VDGEIRNHQDNEYSEIDEELMSSSQRRSRAYRYSDGHHYENPDDLLGNNDRNGSQHASRHQRQGLYRVGHSAAGTAPYRDPQTVCINGESQSAYYERINPASRGGRLSTPKYYDSLKFKNMDDLVGSSAPNKK